MSDIRKRTGKKGTTYQVRYPSKATKSGYAYATFRTRKEAQAFRETLGGQPHRIAAEIVSVSDAIQRWLEICEKIGRDGRETVEPETFKEYRRRARVMHTYSWDKFLQDLTPADIVLFRNWLLENHSRDLARRTLSSFHSVLIEMIQQGQMVHDPAAGITVKSGGRYEDDEGDLTIPTDSEMQAILFAADRMGSKNDYMAECWARYRPMIYLATFSGMRPSEYRGLSWDQVHEDRINVRQRADKTGRIGPVKSKAGRRTIFLPQVVSRMLAAWRECCPKSDANLVFPTERGNPVLLANFALGAWRPLLREAGLLEPLANGTDMVRYTPYALRHYYASKLIEKGKDLKFIQTTMGHSRIEVTLNVYGHLIRERDDLHKDTAEEMFAEITGSSCGKSVANLLEAAE